MTSWQKLGLVLALAVMSLNVGVRAAHATTMHMETSAGNITIASTHCLHPDDPNGPMPDGNCCPACSVFCAASCALPAAILPDALTLTSPSTLAVLSGHPSAIGSKTARLLAFSSRAPPLTL